MHAKKMMRVISLPVVASLLFLCLFFPSAAGAASFCGRRTNHHHLGHQSHNGSSTRSSFHPRIGNHIRAAALLYASQQQQPEQTAEPPRVLVQRGMQSFRNYDVPASLEFFNRADETAEPPGSITPYLWQRGISYYYLNQFTEGSAQFRRDVAVNPLDVEEIVWDIACLARVQGSETSSSEVFPPETLRSKMMALPKGKKDRRTIMSVVYSLFRGDGATEYDLRTTGHDGSLGEEFYSLFYLGLYCEIRNEPTKAEKYMRSAASSAYATGKGAGDYMVSCAKVHCKLRGWEV